MFFFYLFSFFYNFNPFGGRRGASCWFYLELNFPSMWRTKRKLIGLQYSYLLHKSISLNSEIQNKDYNQRCQIFPRVVKGLAVRLASVLGSSVTFAKIAWGGDCVGLSLSKPAYWLQPSRRRSSRAEKKKRVSISSCWCALSFRDKLVFFFLF